MKNTFRKSLIVLLIVGILISSLAPHTGFAQNENLLGRTGGCGAKNLVGMGLFECLIQAIDYVAYAVVYYIVGWVTGIAGNILSYTLGLTINNANYAGNPVITAGWQFSRDIVNIFFIFAILFIAIATILGIESYGAKALLARLIIIALLVNFSLLATQAIIYVTNALAYELYGAITVGADSSNLLTSGDQKFRKDISGALMQSLLQQKIFKADPSKLLPGAGAQNPVSSPLQTNIGVLVMIIAAAIIMLFAAFIFLAGSFFFVARMTMLWLLMVLAPFGFVFLILPATKGYAQKWWSTLQSQAIFAPAFLFFILLTIRMAQSDPLKIMEKINALPNEAPGATDLLFLLILQNMIIFIMLGAGLMVAKSMGIYGADAGIKMAQGAGKAFRGYAGKIGKRAVTAGTAPMAEKLATSDSRFAKTLRLIPGVTRGASGVAAAGRKSVEDYSKEIEHLRPRELKNLIGQRWVQPTQSTAIMQKLIRDGDISEEGGLTGGKIKAVHNQMKRMGMSTTDLERLRPDLAEPSERDIAEATEKYGAKDGPQKAKEAAMRKAASRQRTSDIEKLGPEIADNKPAMQAIAESASPGNIRAFVNKGGPIYDALKKQYEGMGDTLDEIANALDKVGNRAAADWMRTSAGAKILGIPRGNIASTRSRSEVDDEDDDEEPTEVRSRPARTQNVREERPSQTRREAAQARPATEGGNVVIAPQARFESENPRDGRRSAEDIERGAEEAQRLRDEIAEARRRRGGNT